MSSIQNDIIRYLRQQRETYGANTYVVSGQHSAVALPEEPVAQMQTSNEEIEMPPKPLKGWQAAGTIMELNDQICNCLECPLGSTRTSFVFGSGDPNADVMVIGEAPGADEDATGEPFVGRAGKLLTKILEAIDLPREKVFICNILKCRPPNNRKPSTAETDTCEPYLWKQIELVKPKYILALGLTAANTLLRTKSSMKDLRGDMHDYQGIPTIVTYHPAALLRNPNWKKDTWEDVQKLQTLLENS